MWETIKSIIYRIFGRRPARSDDEERQSEIYAQNYRNIAKINYTAIIAGRLATLAVNDSTAVIDAAQSTRAEYLCSIKDRAFAKMKNAVAMTLGTGAAYLIPYVAEGKIYADIVDQSRAYITASRGDDITGVAVLAEYLNRNDRDYIRWIDYAVENGDYIIRSVATCNGVECSLDEIAEWSDIAPEIRISGVDRLPIGRILCPADNRTGSCLLGVPITYGADSIIEEIRRTNEQINREFEKKGVKVFADVSMFDKDGKVDKDLYTKFTSERALGETGLFEVYSPDIRDSSYYNRLTNAFEQLEKAIGVNRGILTDLKSYSGTATEIRRSTYDTWALIGAIRANIIKAFDDFIYGCDILCNAFSLSPMGEYTLTYDWDYSLLEDSSETFAQLVQAKNMGAVSTVDIRQFVKPDETIEEAQAAVDEIKANQPTLRQTVGIDE